MAERINAEPSSAQLSSQSQKVSEKRVGNELEIASDQSADMQKQNLNQSPPPLFTENKPAHSSRINTKSDNASSSLLSARYLKADNGRVKGETKHRSSSGHGEVDLQKGSLTKDNEDVAVPAVKRTKGRRKVILLLLRDKTNESNGGAVQHAPEAQGMTTGQEPHREKELKPCMGGKKFLSRNSAILSQLTVWSPQEWVDNRQDFPGIHRFPTLTPAYWPQISELRETAKKCSAGPYGATLPAPKSKQFGWGLGTPAPFSKKPGKETVAWSGIRRAEVPWEERARVCIPVLDRVMGSGSGVEQNPEQLETEWVGKVLWEAIEED